MDFAVIRVAGKQHVVSPGMEIEITGDPAKIEVLLLSTGDKMIIGTPLVDQASIKTEVLSKGKGEKIHVVKFKAKSRYRRKMGFRPLLTKLKILSIGDEKVSDNSGKQPRVSKSRAKKPSKV
jgi:large subunit ribosomal protein L21